MDTKRTRFFNSPIKPLVLSVAMSSPTAILMSTEASAQAFLEEIVVTARKREETLQDAPVAVTALSGMQLQDAGVNQLSDLTQQVPNLDMADGNGTSGAGNIFIRGVGERYRVVMSVVIARADHHVILLRDGDHLLLLQLLLLSAHG